MKQYRMLDLFCGAGGFSCGLDMVDGFSTEVALDFDANAIDTFQHNFPNTYCMCGDICDSDVKEKIINKCKERKVNMVIGGPPCQGFSLKGKNLGLKDPRNFLFLEYVEIVSKVKPKIFIIENVKNMTSSGKGYFIQQIYEKFHELGYTLNHGILNAYNFGVPQTRERTIIIGTLDPKGIPLPTEYVEVKTTVRDAISDLSYLNSGEGNDEADYRMKSQSQYQEMLRNGSNKLHNHKATNHSKAALEKLKLIPPEGDKTSMPEELYGRQKFMTTWSRLIWDKPSPTIDTRFDTPSNGRNSHPYLQRSITPREAARIQSFPDTFVFYGSKCAICKQIGNAVPPLLARALGEHIKKYVQENKLLTEIEIKHGVMCSTAHLDDVKEITVDIKLSKVEQVNLLEEEKEPNFQVYNADALEIVDKFIADGVKVNHIITDPPYNISQDNNFSTMKNPRAGVDFGEWDRGEFDLCSWIPKYAQLLERNGSMIIFCSYRYISYLIDALEDASAGMVVKDVFVWQKSNPMPRNIDRRYVQDMEFAIWAVKKRAKWVFNKPIDEPYLRAMYTTSTVSGKEKLGHPTQKSLKLMERLISIHTNPNEIILDPFMGSGSTGAAALIDGRRFIGVEREEKYFNMAKTRLENIDI